MLNLFRSLCELTEGNVNICFVVEVKWKGKLDTLLLSQVFYINLHFQTRHRQARLSHFVSLVVINVVS